MQLGLIDAAGLASTGDNLAALYSVVALDENLIGMRVGRNPAIVMADQHEIAVALKLAAGIGDATGFHGMDVGAQGKGDIDAIVMGAIRARAKARNHAAPGRPAEFSTR